MAPLENLAGIFKALADPTRLRLVALIVERERCGRDLASELGVSGPTVSHHLRVLREAGLLRETQQAPYVFFSLDHKALQATAKALSSKKTVASLAHDRALPEAERKVLRTFFDGSRLVAIPAQRKKKLMVFEEVLRRLPRRKEYGERELSRFIEAIHADFCTIRREFIMNDYMTRKNSRYQLTERGRQVHPQGRVVSTSAEPRQSPTGKRTDPGDWLPTGPLGAQDRKNHIVDPRTLEPEALAEVCLLTHSDSLE